MFMPGDSSRNSMDNENFLNPQLWHACAGGMVRMPPVDSKVYYFPQGHAEHANGNVDFGNHHWIPAQILCRVAGVKFLADRETDEVYAKIHLVPVRNGDLDYFLDDGAFIGNGPEVVEKPRSFTKILTQSDANNGGGFSVPRYCAETIFPRLDYSVDPPVQTVLAKDVHGETWKFRHIYRGTPRRHLLTTGWSTFVNQKRLIAGDAIVFMRSENGDLCLGIRRAKRVSFSGAGSSSGWSLPSGNCVSPFVGFSAFLKDDKLMKNASGGNSNTSGGVMWGRSKLKPESVVEAASLAASGKPFEAIYYPRASTPEFCVNAAAVMAAMRFQWCCGMKFKMAFETEDSSRISWFMGTITSVQVADPVRWPNSIWRLLQVTWDEPDLLQNVIRVSPWLVELVSTMPTIPLSPFSQQRKKMRPLQLPDFPLSNNYPAAKFSGNLLGPINPIFCLPGNAPARIQGARHTQFGPSLPNLHFNNPQMGLFAPINFQQLDYAAPPSRITSCLVSTPSVEDDVSCLLTIGNSSQVKGKCDDGKAPQLMLFGKPIFTEQQMSLSFSMDSHSPVHTGNSSSDGNQAKVPNWSSDGQRENSFEGFPWHKDDSKVNLGMGIGHCKVFMESEDVGRTLDLSVLRSYEELYRRLANMFGIDRPEMLSHIIYCDASGAVKHTGDEPFSEFMKTAQRLMVLTDSGSDNVGRPILSEYALESE